MGLFGQSIPVVRYRYFTHDGNVFNAVTVTHTGIQIRNIVEQHYSYFTFECK